MKKAILSLTILMMTSLLINSQVSIIAHRGASWLAPENTIAAANLAWDLDADAVECDIWLSADGKIIVSHDATTKRTTGKDYRISGTDSRLLRKLDAGSFRDEKFRGEKLPFLHELIKTVPRGKELVVEIKCGAEVLPHLVKTISKYEKKRTFSFICFNFDVIAETKKLFPGNDCYWLCSNASLLETTFKKVPEAGLEGISLNYSIINEDVMKKASSMGLEVYSWTVDDPGEAKRLIALGVKGITTNRPGWLEEQMR
jgi:glycerophosphoryl diester phosphodiesterase